MRYIFIICLTILFTLKGQAQTIRTIHVATAGTLSDYISETEKYNIEELTLTGNINGTDFRLLRDMAGNNYMGEITEGNLKVLDMSGAKFVAGGGKYLDTDRIYYTYESSTRYRGGSYHYSVETANVMPQYVFAYCQKLASVTIPNSVTEISIYAFWNCSGLTSIMIPNSVTSIGNSAFVGCEGLTSITIPNSVTNIGDSAFSGCSGLTSITIPNSVTSIGNSTFSGCKGLISITIPNSVTSIGNSAFSGCSGLISIEVQSGNAKYDSRNGCNAIIETSSNTIIAGCKNTTIPNTVTSIGNSAFSGCSGLTSITIPNTVTSIGNSAFYGCSGLTSITIPNSVTSIDNSAFYNCYHLTSCTMGNGVTSIGDKAFYSCGGLTSVLISDFAAWCNIAFTSSSSNPLYFAHHLFLNGDEVTDLVIPNRVTSIGDYTFCGYSNLKSATIGNSVASIGNYAFSDCTGLTSVTLGNSITSIGLGVFSNCSSLTTLNVESGNQKYDSRNSCNAIIETSTNTLIVGCKNTTIPNSVTNIGGGAFLNCSGLTSITIPNNVSTIDDGAFYGCGNLNVVNSEIENPFEIGEHVFTPIYTSAVLIVPSGKKTSYQALNSWNKFSSIVESSSAKRSINVTKAGLLPNLITESEKYTILELKLTGELNGTDFRLLRDMAGCDFSGEYTNGRLTKLDMSEAKIVRGGKAYIESYNLPEYGQFAGQIYVDDVVPPLAFYGCRKLEHVILPNTVSKLEYYAFALCTGLTSMSLPVSVTSIEERAFRKCTGLTSVSLPNSLTYIGSYAFEGCSGITSIVLPESLTSTGYGTFSGCTGLTSIAFHNITTIESNAFSDCIGLTSIIFPNSLTGIDAGAFSGCTGLTVITIPENVNNVSGGSFGGCINLANINVVPSNAYYTSIDGVLYDKDIKKLCIYPLGKGLSAYSVLDGVTSIFSSAFSGCTDLTSISLPNSLTSIDSSAFYGCSGLTSISLPNSLTNIGSSAFYGCSGLTSISFPNSLTSIGSSAFYFCTGLTSIGFPNNLISIGNEAFRNCHGLTSVVFPNSLTSIGEYAFCGCRNLTSISLPNSLTSIGFRAFAWIPAISVVNSKIMNPFPIKSSVFEDSYDTAKLIVPFGTKAKYMETNYWNLFVSIEEDNAEAFFDYNGILYNGEVSALTLVVQNVTESLTEVEIPSEVEYNGKTFQVTSVADGALSGRKFNYVSLPSTISSISPMTFSGSTLGALIWNADAPLSSEVFSNMSNTVDANFLLYVNDQSYAPSNVKNVVVGTTASSIMLADAKNTMFYCPMQFTATTISYTHNYSMETGGTGMGWESIALPFDVQKIEHATKGELTPFASYNPNSYQLPFWLYEMGGNGFRRAGSIAANTPYIISMPNSSAYDEEYILTGDVTFSASNATVQTTSPITVTAGTKTFVPAFSVIEKNATVYALNVTNDLVSEPGSYVAGSRFVSDLREVYPFEAYMTSTSTSAPYLSIEFDNGTTGLDMIPESADVEKTVTIYSLAGHKILGCKRADFENHWNMLPTGVYIVNGKKRLK